MKKKIIIINVFLFFILTGIVPSFGQSKSIDSLLLLIHKGTEDSTKVNRLNEVASLYLKIYNNDSALFYSEKSGKLSQKLNYQKGIAEYYFKKALFSSYQTDYDSSIIFFQKAGKIYAKIAQNKELLSTYVKIGTIYSEQNEWNKAIIYLNKGFTIASKLKDIKSTATIFNNLSQIYYAKDNYPKALEYLLICLKFKEIIGNKSEIALCYSNLGAIYSSVGNYQEAQKSYSASLSIRQELKDNKSIAVCYNNIGLLQLDQNNNSEALNYFNKALEISKLKESYSNKMIVDISNNIGAIYLNEKKLELALEYITNALKEGVRIKYKDGIAVSYNMLGSIYIQMNNLKAAREYLKKAVSYSTEIESQFLLAENYDRLSILDSIEKNWEDAFKHQKLAMMYKNKISNEATQRKMVEISLTSKYEKQKELIKAENEKQQAIAAEKNRRQTVISWSIGGGLFLVLLFAGFILRSLRITSQQKNIIEAQKDEVTKQKDIAEELRMVSEKQKHIVEEKQKEILDSITYAKRIQTALLTSEDYIINNFEAEHFVLFKPKDIVSGDFYWALSLPFIPGWDLNTNKVKLPPDEKRKNLFYIATADCTGHGVPGAFMSMLNISFLNENIIERGILLPNEILNSQRKEIIQSLNPPGSKEESKDGMDCVLCVYDFNKMLLHFAAANNPLWLIRNNELIEYKADKMPVGKYHEKTENFALQTIELLKNDVVYTSTDGFADQFGVNGKKMMKKKFKEELLKIHKLPLNEQKIYLDTFFENWKGNTEQVDDVCVIGVRI